MARSLLSNVKRDFKTSIMEKWSRPQYYKICWPVISRRSLKLFQVLFFLKMTIPIPSWYPARCIWVSWCKICSTWWFRSTLIHIGGVRNHHGLRARLLSHGRWNPKKRKVVIKNCQSRHNAVICLPLHPSQRKPSKDAAIEDGRLSREDIF